MEQVYFFEQSGFQEKAHNLFVKHRAMILERIPEADIQHVGSTSISESVTKGDLDIQVRVIHDYFKLAVEALSKLYALNAGSEQTEYFRAFKDDDTDPPLGIQLTVINSELDLFWKLRDVLNMNEAYRNKYNQLKMNFDGKSMDDYREAKNLSFEWLMETPEFRSL
jgi:GrpB-like predicted nucleotidyltransferase (UPF0157 family)